MAAHAHEASAVNDVHWLSAAEIAAAYSARRLSPVELVQALLDRISAHDRHINAFIHLDAEAALDAARAAEKEICAGRVRGPLHGVPVGIKDIIDIAGQPTTCHSKIMLENVARQDASVISRLRAAGAIMLGKLSLHEFAIGGPSFDLPFPPARNPWNLRHHPGGSSSGSGAALAAGLVPLALGTDTGGSIRNPAGTCGVVGLKPTYGLVSRRGVFPLAFTLDHVGPMARSARDIALTLDAIAGHDAGDPGSAAVSCHRFGADLERGARGLRIGFVRPSSLDPACRIDDAETLARTYPRQARSPFNLTGHPAAAMMCGLSRARLPLSVQFVGRAHDEITVLRAAAAYERATEWHAQRPPIDMEGNVRRKRA